MVVKEKGKDDGAWNALDQKISMLDKMCIKTIESELRGWGQLRNTAQ